MLRIDLFQQIIKLNHNGSSNFTTNTGCIFTICIIVITLIQLIITFKSILNHESPQITSEVAVVQDPVLTSLSSSDFVFAVSVYGMNLSSSFASFQMDYYTATQDDNGTLLEEYTPIPFIRCSPEYLKNYSADYVIYNLQEAVCPVATGFQFAGAYRETVTLGIDITVTGCVNDTSQSDIVCQSEEEIAEYLQNNDLIYINVYYSNHVISPSNYSTPVSYFLDNAFWYFPPNSASIEAEIFIDEVNIITDDNLFLEGWNTKNLTTYQIDQAEIKTLTNTLESYDDTYTLVDILILKSTQESTTTRLYPKIQQGLANVGSVFTLLLGVFGIILFPYINRAYAVNLAKRLYKFDFQEMRQKGTAKIRPKPKKDSMTKPWKKEGNSALRTIDIENKPKDTNNLTAGKQDIDSQMPNYHKEILRYTFKDFVFGILPCLRRKKDLLIDKAVTKVQEDIDLCEIVKKLQEFDRIKQILLDEDELRILSYPQQPIISLDKHSKENKFNFSEKDKRAPATSKKIDPEAPSMPGKKERNNQFVSLIKILKKNSKESPQNDTRDEFAVSYKSYSRLLMKMRKSPVSRKILKSMDRELSDIFFDYRMKFDPVNKKKMANEETKMNEVIHFNENRVPKMSKLEGALIICEKLESYYYYSRRSKQKSSKSGNSDLVRHDNNEKYTEIDYSIRSETRLMNIGSLQADIVIRIDEDSLQDVKTMPSNRRHF